MKSVAIFKEHSKYIIKEISEAKNSIFIAVAWFTDETIFNKLLEKINQNCTIALIINDDEINNNSNIDFNKLQTDNSRVIKIKCNNEMDDVMHHKFCIIDKKTVITGSLNWTYKAKSNRENIQINYEAEELAEQYYNEFKDIVRIYYNDNSNISRSNLLLIQDYFEVIEKLIHLGEFPEIEKYLQKIQSYELIPNMSEIIENYNKNNYLEIISLFNLFFKDGKKYITENYDDFINFIEKKHEKDIYGNYDDTRDGKSYKTAKIGEHIWMAENLAFFMDKGCHAINTEMNSINTYGYMYDWEAAKKATPDGWHLPSFTEIKLLIYNLGGYEVAGPKLIKNCDLWLNEYNNEINQSGFSAIPSIGAATGLRPGLGFRMWSSSPAYSGAFNFFILNHGHKVTVNITHNPVTLIFSVRCVKDYDIDAFNENYKEKIKKADKTYQAFKEKRNEEWKMFKKKHPTLGVD